jgi:hypothetical protein
MPTKERRKRDRERECTLHGHKVSGIREGWNADKNAVALLCEALGYPTRPPTPIPSLTLENCRFHVLP